MPELKDEDVLSKKFVLVKHHKTGDRDLCEQEFFDTEDEAKVAQQEYVESLKGDANGVRDGNIQDVFTKIFRAWFVNPTERVDEDLEDEEELVLELEVIEGTKTSIPSLTFNSSDDNETENFYWGDDDDE